MKMKLLPILLIITIGTATFIVSCRKDVQKSEDPSEEPVQEINAVLLKSDTGVYIPITNKKVRLNRLNLEKELAQLDVNSLRYSIKVPDPAVLARSNNRVVTSRAGKTGTGNLYEMGSLYTTLKRQTDWYLLRNGVRVAYLGTTPGTYATLTYTAPLDCGYFYDVEIEQQVYDPVSGTYTTHTDRSEDSVYGFSMITSPGVGSEGAGAAVVIANINNNSAPDVLFMANDNPSGQNSYRYYIYFDVNNNGTPATISSTKNVLTGLNDVAGSGADIADIDGNGVPDLILMSYDEIAGTNNFVYKIGWNLNASGDAASWSSNIIIPGLSGFGKGADIALADIDKNGTLDIMLMCADAPSSGTGDVRYKIGWNINSSGTTASWSGTFNFTTGNIKWGIGLDLVDLNNDGNVWMTFYVVTTDPTYGQQYLTQFRLLNTAGAMSPTYYNWNPPAYTMGASIHGTGVAVGDLNLDGKKDLIQMTYDNPAGMNSFRSYFMYGLSIEATGFPWFLRSACTY